MKFIKKLFSIALIGFITISPAIFKIKASGAQETVYAKSQTHSTTYVQQYYNLTATCNYSGGLLYVQNANTNWVKTVSSSSYDARHDGVYLFSTTTNKYSYCGRSYVVTSSGNEVSHKDLYAYIYR